MPMLEKPMGKASNPQGPLPGASRGKGGRFLSPQPLWNDYLGAIASLLRRSAHSKPKQSLPVIRPSAGELAADSDSGLRATWLGHSTVYLEIDGVRVLTDPVWGERASPFRWAGPKRFFAPLIDRKSVV